MNFNEEKSFLNKDILDKVQQRGFTTKNWPSDEIVRITFQILEINMNSKKETLLAEMQHQGSIQEYEANSATLVYKHYRKLQRLISDLKCLGMLQHV